MTTCTDCRLSPCRGTPIRFYDGRNGLRVECLRCGAQHITFMPRPSRLRRFIRWCWAPLL